MTGAQAGDRQLTVQSADLLKEIEAHSGELVRRCFQCDRCATGCPMVSYMQHTPNELFRLIQLGAREAVLSSNAFWFCVSCYTCSVRCPNDIDIAHVMDTLRELSLREGFAPALPQARDFHQIFLGCVRRGGRVSELELMARYNLKLKKPFARAALGWELLRKRRLELWPRRGRPKAGEGERSRRSLVMRFYPGCTLSSSARPYKRSLDWVWERLGIEIEELPGWTCCGATSAHALNRDLAYALPARNLAIAQELGSDLLVACSACYSRLKITQKALENPQTRERISRAIERPLDGRVQIKNILEVLSEHAPRIQKEKIKALEGLKVACYYGCLATRIPRVTGFDDREHPTMMERLVLAAGATAVEWPAKTSCCGASFSVISEEIALKMCSQILEMARRCRADVLVTSCPFCQYNLDWAQWTLSRKDGREPTIPVLFITQLVGLALGGSEKDLMLNSHLVGSEKITCRTQPTVNTR